MLCCGLYTCHGCSITPGRRKVRRSENADSPRVQKLERLRALQTDKRRRRHLAIQKLIKLLPMVIILGGLDFLTCGELARYFPIAVGITVAYVLMVARAQKTLDVDIKLLERKTDKQYLVFRDATMIAGAGYVFLALGLTVNTVLCINQDITQPNAKLSWYVCDGDARHFVVTMIVAGAVCTLWGLLKYQYLSQRLRIKFFNNVVARIRNRNMKRRPKEKQSNE